jgi:hypothetical protein
MPQVLAGLGMVSLMNAGCLFWLQRLQPVFLIVAFGSLLYEIWLFSRHPPALRKWDTKAILATSVMLNAGIIVGWIAIWVRYR